MQTRCRLISRGLRCGTFYYVDKQSGKRHSLETRNKSEARQIVEAMNIAERQPLLNLQIAKAYLLGGDPGMKTRTVQDALQAVIATKQGSNQERWARAAEDRAFDLIRYQVIIEVRSEHLLKVLQVGTVSTNVFLRCLYNFCLDMGWLPVPLIPKRQWPAVRFKVRRAITLEEH